MKNVEEFSGKKARNQESGVQKEQQDSVEEQERR